MTFKVGVALGGGAARGLAHLGVLKALEEAKVPVDIITGTSIGGIMGAVYAAHPDAKSCIEQIRYYLHSPHFNRARLSMIKESEDEASTYFSQVKKFFKGSIFYAISAMQPSFITLETMKNNIEHVVAKVNQEDCDIPLGLVATDLQTGEEIHFTSGSMVQNVMASCAIPGVFPPIQMDGRHLVDGSWVHPVPVSLARQMGADFVIAVDVTPHLGRDEKEHTGLNINLRASEATRIALKNYNLKEADYVITVDAMSIHWADFMQLDFCVKEGDNTTKKHIEQIQRAITRKKIKSFFW